MPEKRNHLIDLLRILAASMVVLFHFNSPLPYINNWYRWLCSFGYLGVPMFFVISGYCILIAFNHAKKPPEFAIRRFFRIFPPYWFSVVLVVVIAIGQKLFTGISSVPIPKDILSWLFTFSLLTDPLTKVKTINWVYWTLPYEVMFYLLIFLIGYGKKSYFTFALIAITVIGIFLPKADTGFISFFRFLPLFTLGVCLYQLINRNYFWLNLVLLYVSIIALFIGPLTYLYIITAFITAALILFNHHKPMRENLVSKFGDVSYSLYLIHVPIGVYILGRLSILTQGNLIEAIVVQVLLLVFLIYLSAFMHKFIEIPAIKIGKKIKSN